MILIALGANLPSRYGSPAETLKAAVKAIEARDIQITQSSRIWLTAPVPYDPNQDWYYNSVIAIETDLSPQELLQTLFYIEAEFGRVRSKDKKLKNAPRLLDLDLIAYNNEVIEGQDSLIVPHPRMHERLFVLNPLEDINKDWVHPKLKRVLSDMIASCPEDQQAKPINEEAEEAHHD